MKKDLLKHSKSELIALLEDKQQVIEKEQQKRADLEQQLAYLKRKLFGQSRERFESQDQLQLPFAVSEELQEEQADQLVEKIEYTRQKQKKQHPGRAKLPENLDVEEIEIYPQGDLSDLVCIGKEVTEELECIPEKFYIKRYIRYKYAPKNKEGKVIIGALPERVIDKGIPGVTLLAMLLINKYADHLPLYRQKQRFTRQGIQIASSTLEGWTKRALQKLLILYEYLVEDTRAKGYLQVDETTIKVMDSAKKGATHLGYYWVYHNPIDGMVLFDYQPGRSLKASQNILKDFKGYLQTDAYKVYEFYGKKNTIIPLICWAHARRGFFEAIPNDKQRAEQAMGFIQQLYQVEQQAREQKLDAEQRKHKRLQEALPVLKTFKKWLDEQLKSTLPKSPIGKAIQYCLGRWPAFNHYLLDGHLEIDNNLVENAIRPVALGRKNYLFAGSHEAAKRAAAIYSFLAICKKHQVNEQEWLQYTLQNIMSINHKNIKDLYPQNYKKIKQKQ